MKEELLNTFKRKGITTAEEAIEELLNSRILAHHDLSKYNAREKFLHVFLSESTFSSTMTMHDVAYKYSIGKSTLRRLLDP